MIRQLELGKAKARFAHLISMYKFTWQHRIGGIKHLLSSSTHKQVFFLQSEIKQTIYEEELYLKSASFIFRELGVESNHDVTDEYVGALL